MVATFQERLPQWELTIQHDNARHHIAHQVKQWITDRHISFLTQAPYSPDTDLMDCFLFRNYECFRRGHDFGDIYEVIDNMQAFLTSQTIEKRSKEFKNLKLHLKTCLLYTSPSPRD